MASKAKNLENLWAMPESSAAMRASVVAMAFEQLGPEEQKGWGARAAQSICELGRSGNPMKSGSGCLPVDESYGAMQGARSGVASALEQALCEVASLSALSEALVEFLRLARHESAKEARRLPGEPPSRDLGDMAKLAQVIFNATLARYAKAGWGEEVERLCREGFKLEYYALKNLLEGGGALLDRPEIVDAARKEISEHLADGRKGGSAQTADRISGELLVCAKPLWVEALLSASEVPGHGVATVWNLEALGRLAKMQALRTPENFSKAQAENKNLRRKLYKTALPASETSAAEMVSAAAFGRSGKRLDELLARDPHQVARMVCGGGGDWMQKRERWARVGLDTVDAKSFLGADWMVYKVGGVANASSAGRSMAWPNKAAISCDMLDGERLGFADCAALSGASRAELEELISAGSYPTKGLAACLSGPAKLSWGKEEATLWVVSISQNAHAPEGKGGPRL